MENNTDIILIVDRSGSMMQIQSDAEGGINKFIEDQRSGPDDAILTLVQFDTDYEFIHRRVPIKDVPTYRLVPRGCTALLDAVGRSITETGERLASIPENERPKLVIVVVVTDGMENSSVEYKRDQVREMILHQQQKYAWQFVFLAANQDAFAEAGSMGIPTAGAADYAPSLVRQAYAAAGNNVMRMRTASASGHSVQNFYTDEERTAMKGSE